MNALQAQVKSGAVVLNDKGHLEDFEAWSEEVALALAASDGIPELSARHWKVIHYVRDYYRRFRVAPMIHKLCKETDISLAEMGKLFPKGPAKGVCKVAGLPKPTGCL